jgi:predicted amidohydrolase
MKIGVAQARPVKGDIRANISNHLKLIEQVSPGRANAVFFPELSLTGYEPTLARELAADLHDPRLDVLQNISDYKNLVIGVGMPTHSGSGILISMIIFQPHSARQIYSKQYLHPDEFPYFVNGHGQLFLNMHNSKIAPAICYELSVAHHAHNAFDNGATIYLASVAKTLSGVESAVDTLAGIAKKYSVITLMANSVGFCDGVECAGKTSVWNSEGVLLGQLDNNCEGILIVDTETQELIQKLSD